MNTTAELDAEYSTLERNMTIGQSQQRKHRAWVSGISISIALVAFVSWKAVTNSPVAAGAAKQESDWPAYGRDAGGSRYSPLGQINRGNVGQLKMAWTYRTGAIDVKAASAKNAAFEATPILVDGALYLTTPYNRVIALDPATGAERWTYDPQVKLDQRYSEMTSRGVSAWPAPNDKRKIARRIFAGTLDARLIALDAATGKPCADFGENGQVDLTNGVRLVERGNYQVTSPPAVIGDSIVVGSAIGDNRGVELERGVVRAYDARTGKLQWSWDPIPKNANDPARKTWAGESANRTGAANAWSIISADSELGLVFIPTSSPSPDFYGGERKGDNRYANSIVALRAATGEVVWSFQVVHHDIWDYDVASQPMLINLKRNGRDVPVVAVGTKMGMIFVLDRRNGKPIFPVEERPVPQSTVPGEQTSATQPFPTAAAAARPAQTQDRRRLGFDRQGPRRLPRDDRGAALRRNLHAAEPRRHGRDSRQRRRYELERNVVRSGSTTFDHQHQPSALPGQTHSARRIRCDARDRRSQPLERRIRAADRRSLCDVPRAVDVAEWNPLRRPALGQTDRR